MVLVDDARPYHPQNFKLESFIVDISAAAFVPALTTLAAALIAGGIAHSNLIISKEVKTSEFR